MEYAPVERRVAAALSRAQRENRIEADEARPITVPRNVEIKARARDFAGQSLLARELGAREPEHFFQEDTFFNVPHGRLKLRDFGNGQGDLIQYARENTCEPRKSRYSLVPTSNPNVLKHMLGNAIGVRAVVRKQRWVHRSGEHESISTASRVWATSSRSKWF